MLDAVGELQRAVENEIGFGYRVWVIGGFAEFAAQIVDDLVDFQLGWRCAAKHNERFAATPQTNKSSFEMVSRVAGRSTRF